MGVPSTEDLKLNTSKNNFSLSTWVYMNSSDPTSHITQGGYIISKPWNGDGRYNYYMTRNSVFRSIK